MTEGQTPAGWYDDGQGQLRWYDGTAWTEHVQPLPAAAPPPAETPAAQPAAQAQPAAPAQPAQTPAAQPAAAAAPAAGGTAIGAPGTHGAGDPWAEPTPIYRKPWFLIVLVLVVLAVIAGIFLLSSGDDDEPTSSATTPTNAASAPAGGTGGTGGTTGGTTGGATGGVSGVGADAATVATAAGCTGAAPVTVTPPTTGPAPKSKVSCTLNGTSYTVVTWNSVADQNAEGALANAFTQPVTAGTKYYATGEGWTAFDAAYDQAAATAFATPAGGTAKGVVVVLSSSPAP